MIAESLKQDKKASTPLKRSLFSKPAWSKPQNLSDSSLFHRSDQTYINLTAQAELKRERKLGEKRQARSYREESDGCTSKRRRLSDDGEDDDDDDQSRSDEESVHSSDDKARARDNPTINDQTASRLSPLRPNRSLIPSYETTGSESTLVEEKREAEMSHIVDLGDDEELVEVSASDVGVYRDIAKPSKPLDEDDPPSDADDFPELAHKAREKAIKKRLEQELMPTIAPNIPPSTQQESSVIESQPTHYPTTPPDPVLQILITSEIANTQPLIVNRRLSQRLKDVRLAWAQRQGLTQDVTNMVFLTWRGKRLFDVTSCKSLGITVDVNGDISTRGDILSDEEGQIHMQAMTAEIFEAYKNARRIKPGVENEDQRRAEGDSGKEEKKETQLRIILKSKGFDDFKLIVKPVCIFTPQATFGFANGSQSTLISKIVKAFRSTNSIGAEREVFLSFDGERLSTQSKVVETELSGMDEVDVYVR